MKKEYLNHSDIAICIEHGDQKKAISLFKEKIDKHINLSSSLNGLKNILGGLNLFLYTYFILHERPHLEDLCFKNMERIYEFKERDRFEEVGIEIIKSYGRCCNYICEECSCSQKDLINNAMEYIDNNLDSKLKLDDVARYVHQHLKNIQDFPQGSIEI